MTLGKLKNTVSGFLIGDNVLPDNNDIVVALLDAAYNDIINHVESLHLLTMDRNKDIIRTASGEYLMRMPNSPETDNDDLDIDHEVGFIAARFIASYVSKDNKVYHESQAIKLINHYNGKVEAILARVRHDDTREDGDQCYVQ